MMYGFLDLILSIGFIVALSNAIGMNVLFSIFRMQYTWLPAVFLIVLSYHVLTKVYPYEVKDGLEDCKVHSVQK